MVNLVNLTCSFDSAKFNNLNYKKYSLINVKKLLIYAYLVSPNLIKEVISKTGLEVVLTKDIKKANLIIGLKKYLKQNLKLKKFAQQKNIPIYIVNRPTFNQIVKGEVDIKLTAPKHKHYKTDITLKGLTNEQTTQLEQIKNWC